MKRSKLHFIANKTEFTIGMIGWAFLLLTATASRCQTKRNVDTNSTRVYFNSKQYYIFQNLNDSTKVATLRFDTLFVHKPDLVKILEQSDQPRELHWKGKVYKYRFAFYDISYFYARLKGINIY